MLTRAARAEGERQRVVAEGSGQRHGGGQQISVPEVVHGRADPGAAQVAEHEQVGQQDHRRHQPPRLVRGREQDQRRREQHEAVKPQPSQRFPGHRGSRVGHDLSI
jgi:hypothetical protein